MNRHWSFALRILVASMGFAGTASADEYSSARERMVKTQITARDIRDSRVIDALAAVPRHEFVPANLRALAYEDGPLPIGHEQTISQPYIVALSTDLLDLERRHRVLEIGTGSGYQAAVLAELVAHVSTIEIVPALGDEARARLAQLGYVNVDVRIGDGYAGWPERAPFDRILVTAAAPSIPDALVQQLARGGRMVIPVGNAHLGQRLMLVEKTASGAVTTKNVLAVRFVPMVEGKPAAK